MTLFFETLLIIVIFNASSYFRTTTYAKSIDSIGVVLTIFLLFWIWMNSRFRFGYGTADLGLTTEFVSRKHWIVIFVIVVLLYSLAFTAEIVFPSEVKGEITLIELFRTAVFTLMFGPIFEELLFRGYLYKRSQDALQIKDISKVSIASIFSGLAFGFFQLPTPLILIYFNDPIIEVYENLFVFVLIASVMGIILGEIRRRTKSILPGVVLHFCANSVYVIILVLKLSFVV